MPTRTCVGCRARDAQDRLLRIVAGEGEVLPDPGRRLPGRGAYLHPRLACLALAERKRAFPRALRLPGPFALSAVRARLEACEAQSRDGTGTE
ncbi:YlxR family protein [Actinocrinis puniceicyclus]|uniref:YlxR family protein n=1 Tax=Actinocrinis puniceicyclus TaxID=977794 RepID=A0A8J7WNW7_9ACTN|nr:YlxR family protein [Actinocrinis puniceicyclus]MBS2962869.1 YlxR family protein [Actinocrinis puniceicyclus]